MTNIIWSQLDTQDFLTQAKTLAREDHELSLQFIDMLRECERRLLYAEQAYPSLWAWATQYLGLSENMAQIRISAMRLSRDIPDVKPALESGALSLSNAAQLNRFFREEKKAGKTRSLESKKKVIDQITGLSKKACETKLLEINPKAVPVEKERPVSAEKVEIKLVLDGDLVEKLKELKSLLAHSLSPNATYGELIAYMAEKQFEKIKKQRGKKKSAEATEIVPDETRETSLCPEKAGEKVKQTAGSVQVPRKREYISQADRRVVWARAGNCCEYVSAKGKRCSSRHALEIDHRTPLALGGQSDLSSLRILCRTHNRQQAVEKLGQKLMAKYIFSI